jgi:hypothetical protein
VWVCARMAAAPAIKQAGEIASFNPTSMPTMKVAPIWRANYRARARSFVRLLVHPFIYLFIIRARCPQPTLPRQTVSLSPTSWPTQLSPYIPHIFKVHTDLPTYVPYSEPSYLCSRFLTYLKSLELRPGGKEYEERATQLGLQSS